MKNFDAIFWDVDGTLLDFLYSQRYAIRKCFRTAGHEITDAMIERYSRINDMFWKRLELGEITKETLLRGRFLQLFEEYSLKDIDVNSFLAEYQEALGSVYSFIDDSLTICKSLQGHIRQYVVTNGVTSTQKNKLKLSGLAEVMDAVFISEQLGAPKPHKEFFDRCFEQIQAAGWTIYPDRILIVGDSLTSDIKGGMTAGLKTCWYRPENALSMDPRVKADYELYKPDYEIEDLHQIYQVLKLFDCGWE